MPIRRSSALDVSRLMAELASDNALQRETAAARLAIIGARAVTRLLGVAGDEAAPAHARVAALGALEAIGDPRSLAIAESLANRNDEIGVGAIAAIGAVARSGDPRATRAFEALTSMALDRQASESRRLAAVSALEGLPSRQVSPIYAALAEDPNPALSARATRRSAPERTANLSLDAAIDAGLPDEPAVVEAMVREEAETSKVTSLRRLIELLRVRERHATNEARAPWTAARGQVHRALAARRSRLGLYDLRETLEQAAGPLPVGFLAAAAAIGDAACLEPLAAAWASSSPGERWWRDHLAEAFGAIVRREGLTRRNPILKKILERQPSTGVLVAMARK
jgi:hypothetical protein